MLKKIKRSPVIFGRNRKELTVAMAVFGVIGISTLLLTRAATSPNSIEPESGTPSGNVTQLTGLTGASGGGAVKFQAAASTGTGRCQHTATRICYNGKLTEISGINMPWLNWNSDFGGGPNGGGVSATKADIATRLSQFHGTGMKVVRWWMFEGGAPQISRAADGTPTSINPSVYTDIDAALQLADQYDVYYNFTLFSGVDNNGFPSSWRTNVTQRQALANVLGPLFARYKDNPRVMSWELFNEPEWQIWNNLDGANETDTVNLAKVLVSSIRTNAPEAMTTIGEAQLTGIPMWKGVDLDFDSPHYYDHFGTDASVSPYSTTAAAVQAQYGITRPVVIGEFPFSGTSSENLNRLNQAYTRGFAGSWDWSLFWDHTSDLLKPDFPTMTTYFGQHSDIGPR